MRGHGAKFSRKMEEAIAALLTHRNHEEAARAAGIGTATLLRWEKLAEFRKAQLPDLNAWRLTGRAAALGDDTGRRHN